MPPARCSPTNMPKAIPGKRYYGGCQYVDVVEQLAIDRAKRLFNCAFANVQPHSGSQANQSVMLALMKPGDTIMGMSLAAGGHLTHGAPPNLSGKWFNAVQYGVRPDDHRIDYDEVERLAQGAQAGDDHRRRLGLSAHHRLRALPRRSPTPSAPISWSTWRISPGWSPQVYIRARCRMPMSSPPRRTRPARTARRHGALQRRGDRQEDQLRRVPRPPGRPSDAHHRRQGRGLRRGAEARLTSSTSRA